MTKITSLIIIFSCFSILCYSQPKDYLTSRMIINLRKAQKVKISEIDCDRGISDFVKYIKDNLNRKGIKVVSPESHDFDLEIQVSYNTQTPSSEYGYANSPFNHYDFRTKSTVYDKKIKLYCSAHLSGRIQICNSRGSIKYSKEFSGNCSNCPSKFDSDDEGMEKYKNRSGAPLKCAIEDGISQFKIKMDYILNYMNSFPLTD